MPITEKDAPGALPDHAKDIFVAAWNSAYGDTCKERSDRDACASKVAWSAVKAKYAKSGDKWMSKAALVEVDLIITKATLQPDGSMRWQATASDTGPDRMGQRTSLPLFQDWIERAETGKTVAWLSPPRKPFLGVSHYPALDGDGEAGVTERMFVDGKQFKADGVFQAGSPLGKALFDAVRSERELIKKGQAPAEPIRISAAWWDVQHSHGDFVFNRKSLVDRCSMCDAGQIDDVQFLKGQLDHFASTRVPIHPRTVLALEEKSMAGKKTRRDDAASIVGEEQADELESKAQKLVGKAETDEPVVALVIKADDPDTGDAAATEPDVQQMADGMSEEHEYRPLGGAMNMADAESFIQAQQMMDKLYTNWDLFRVVVGNILDAPDGTDKKAELSKTVKEFSDRVDNLKANVSDAYLVALSRAIPATQPAPISGPEPATPSPATRGGAAETAEKGDNIVSEQATTQVTPNDPASVLGVAVKAALDDGKLSREARLQAIQEALNSYAVAVKAQLDAVAPPPAGEEIAQAVKAALQPLADQIGLLAAKLNVPAPVNAPVQKSYQPGSLPVGQPTEQLPVSPVTGQPSAITAMVRRSVIGHQ